MSDDVQAKKFIREVKECMWWAQDNLSEEDYKKYINWMVRFLREEKALAHQRIRQRKRDAET